MEEVLINKSRYSDSQIIGILKQAEAEAKVPDFSHEHGMSDATFYKWRAADSLSNAADVHCSRLSDRPLGEHMGQWNDDCLIAMSEGEAEST